MCCRSAWLKQMRKLGAVTKVLYVVLAILRPSHLPT